MPDLFPIPPLAEWKGTQAEAKDAANRLRKLKFGPATHVCGAVNWPWPDPLHDFIHDALDKSFSYDMWLHEVHHVSMPEICVAGPYSDFTEKCQKSREAWTTILIQHLESLS